MSIRTVHFLKNLLGKEWRIQRIVVAHICHAYLHFARLGKGPILCVLPLVQIRNKTNYSFCSCVRQLSQFLRCLNSYLPFGFFIFISFLLLCLFLVFSCLQGSCRWKRRRPLLTLGITRKRRPGSEQVNSKIWTLGYLFLKPKIDTKSFRWRIVQPPT